MDTKTFSQNWTEENIRSSVRHSIGVSNSYPKVWVNCNSRREPNAIGSFINLNYLLMVRYLVIKYVVHICQGKRNCLGILLFFNIELVKPHKERWIQFHGLVAVTGSFPFAV